MLRLIFDGKHTSSPLILIAGIIIFAHAVVPHHHHFDSIQDYSENRHAGTGQDHDQDTHCYAFNLIYFEKGNNSIVTGPDKSNFPIDLRGIDSQKNKTVKAVAFSRITLFVSALQKQSFETSQLLRAPPATV